MRVPILLFIFCIQQLYGQSWIGYKYTGGIPTHRLFGRPIEYCNGVNIERYTKNILGDESEQHDWRFGFQADFLLGNGIHQNNVFSAVTPRDQRIELSRFIVGGALSTRYTYLEKTLHPYGEFSVGVRDYSTQLSITPGTIIAGQLEYNANHTYINYCLGAGLIYPISNSVKLDFGMNFNIGKKAQLYDFNSVYEVGNELDAELVEVGTSSLQFEFGILINYTQRYDRSAWGNGWRFFDFLWY